MKARYAWLACVLSATALAADEPRIAPFSAAEGGALPPAWQVITLPKITRHTRYSVAMQDGRRVIKAEAEASYANLVHSLNPAIDTHPMLQWSWRVDRVPAGSDLTIKKGDDLAAKVCVLFDVPLERLAIGDRIWVELGRRLFKLDLPAAAICYVWDRTMPAGTWLPNVYTDRVRMLVLRSADAGDLGRWYSERRDLRADFARAFPHEAEGGFPAVTAVALASDADNTGGSALAYFGDIELVRP